MHLREACKEVMEDISITSQYPDGLDGSDILTEIRNKHGEDAFYLCSVLDVIDEMRELYG